MARSILGVLAGIVASTLLVASLEALGHLIWPPPPGIDLSDPEAMKAIISQLPLGAMVSVLMAWTVGVLVGSLLAARIAGRKPLAHGVVIGVIFLAAAIATMVAIPHPRWFSCAAVLLIPAASAIGAHLGRVQPGELPDVPKQQVK